MPERLRIDSGNLQDQLFARGVEFPCGGTALCGGCRVRVIEGDVPTTPEMAEVLTPKELAAGWRLACRAAARGAVTVEIEQWHPVILSDHAELAVEPREGLGIAIDLGTTTLVAQLLDLASGEVLDVRTGLNPQCRHGADLMTRIEFDLSSPGTLRDLIRRELGEMVAGLSGGRAVHEVLLCGNTVMHHIFCGLPVEGLAAVPFETATPDEVRTTAGELGWSLGGGTEVCFLACLGSFVGSDVLAGVIACGLDTKAELHALVDLGTNGEIVVGDRTGLVCASTAAGPAFEAGRIRMGMRAAAGAIDRVEGIERVHVLGGIEPRGLCGSGLVDAAAVAVGLGMVQPNGRFVAPNIEWRIRGPVVLYQSDIRELQLAKGAIAAGLRMLPGAGRSLQRIHLAGAFGNYVSVASARRIGLLPPCEIEPSGNTALRGTKQLLLAPSHRDAAVARIRALTRHVSLASDAAFQDVFAESMSLQPSS